MKNKKKYVSPIVAVNHVEMENGIAAGSVQLNPGTSSSPNSISADDWLDQGTVGNGTGEF